MKTADNPWIGKMARMGLTAKGIVYVILGLLWFLAAFDFGDQSNNDTKKSDVFNSIRNFPGGVFGLAILAAGLICYSLWRGIQTFSNPHSPEKKWTKRIRYFFSGFIYLSFAYTAIEMIFRHQANNGDKSQYWLSQVLNHSYGTWLVGIGALVLALVGIYQVYYGISGRYRKHVQQLNLHSGRSLILLRSGKIGYISRGVVWLIIAYLMLLASIHKDSSEAGDTGKAFVFVESSSFGPYLLAALGIGLIAYGIFNFIRARYETFK